MLLPAESICDPCRLYAGMNIMHSDNICTIGNCQCMGGNGSGIPLLRIIFAGKTADKTFPGCRTEHTGIRVGFELPEMPDQQQILFLIFAESDTRIKTNGFTGKSQRGTALQTLFKKLPYTGYNIRIL